MKFLCLPCDRAMDFAERQLPGDGTLAAVFTCPGCKREMAMLTNPMETQLVSGLGIKIGGRVVPEQPMELTRSSLAEPRTEAFTDETPSESDMRLTGPAVWSDDAIDRLGNVPRFVRGMVKRIYTDWAKESGVREITPEVMDRARVELGLEHM